MQLCINGQDRQIDGVTTICELLEQLELAPERVVVELNRDIIPAGDLAEISLNEGDSLEIIQFVGGG